jgi:hypothetical protein
MAKAYVCDKCGKVLLLEDSKPYMSPTGIYQLVGDKEEYTVDLCESCVKELFESVRNGGDGK